MEGAVISPDQITAYVVGALGSIVAVVTYVRDMRRQAKTDTESELLSDAKMHRDRATMLQKTAEENLSLYYGEREEHKKTRDYWHSKASEFQASLLVAQEKIAELTARPDLTDILRCIENQSRMSTEILDGIKQILLTIETHVIKKS